MSVPADASVCGYYGQGISRAHQVGGIIGFAISAFSSGRYGGGGAHIARLRKIGEVMVQRAQPAALGE